jgi:hypothetical protein
MPVKARMESNAIGASQPVFLPAALREDPCESDAERSTD